MAKTRTLALAACLALLGLAACMNPSKTQKSKSTGLVTEYYKGEGKALYFVKEIAYTGSSKDVKLLIDYTLDYDKSRSNAVVANFTIFSPEPFAKVSGMTFKDTYAPDSIKKMFIEKGKKSWKSRYSVTLDYEDFKKVVSGSNSVIQVNQEGKPVDFIVSKHWPKQAQTIKEQVILQIDLNQ